jgi:competence CoiA-like predicted nuclease
MTKKKYKCPVCDEQVTLYVNPSEPPSHACKKNADKVVEFVETK